MLSRSGPEWREDEGEEKVPVGLWGQLRAPPRRPVCAPRAGKRRQVCACAGRGWEAWAVGRGKCRGSVHRLPRALRSWGGHARHERCVACCATPWGGADMFPPSGGAVQVAMCVSASCSAAALVRAARRRTRWQRLRGGAGGWAQRSALLAYYLPCAGGRALGGAGPDLLGGESHLAIIASLPR